MTKTNNLYHYFDRYRRYADIILNHHEIEKAICQVVGERNFDRKIRRIWENVIKNKPEQKVY